LTWQGNEVRGNRAYKIPSFLEKLRLEPQRKTTSGRTIAI
jgi:hypothetical protein